MCILHRDANVDAAIVVVARATVAAAAIAHASPSPPQPSPAHHRCCRRCLCITVAEEGPDCASDRPAVRHKASKHLNQQKRKKRKEKNILLGPTGGSRGREGRPPPKPMRHATTHLACGYRSRVGRQRRRRRRRRTRARKSRLSRSP